MLFHESVIWCLQVQIFFQNIYTDAPWPCWWWCLPAYCYVWSLSVTRVLFLFFNTGKAEASGSMHVTLCDYIMPWDSLSTTQKKSLSQRYQMGCDCKVRQQRAAFACAVCLVAWRKKRQLFTSCTTHPDITEQSKQDETRVRGTNKRAVNITWLLLFSLLIVLEIKRNVLHVFNLHILFYTDCIISK